MPNKLTLYECEWCKNTYKTEKEAIKCLNSHDIIFAIDKLITDHDCWGSRTSEWVRTDLLFKTYESAVKYCGSYDELRVVCVALNK
jgi:hypothetical protein